MSTISVAIVGVGLVGSSLVRQLKSFAPKPTPSLPIPPRINLVSLSSSTKSLFLSSSANTIPDDWKSALASSSTPFSLAELTSHLASLDPKKNTVVVVDNTSSDAIAAHYPTWLSHHIHVVTPNKKAFSSDLALYESIVSAAAASGVSRCYNEATVGAGLPILSTLRELIATGDKVTKIEGVFSGTFSYIFNQFSSPDANAKKPSFSDVVREAKEKGYTEPHPADDLSGADVARKLTILSRLVPTLSVGLLPKGYASVATSSLVPAALQPLPSVPEEFLNQLAKHDSEFDQMREEAQAKGCVLRYVGVVDAEKGLVEAKLASYPITHPFASSLSGSDNIVAFHTARYADRPLIVQGAGAGADVTAMGVLGDLLKFA